MATPDTLGIEPQPLTGITASASTAYSGWPASLLFDGVIKDSGNSWSASTNGNAWVQAQLSSATAVTSYRIYARTGAPNSCPSDWTFEGSNDATNWTVLDTQSSQTWNAGVGRYYSFSNSTSYLYYKLNITGTQGGGSTWPSFTEWQIFDGASTATTLLDWWKADAITGVSDGASLSATSIVDSSANGHTLTGNVRSGVYRASSGPNSKPFIDGSTTSGFAYSGSAQPAPFGDYTMFAVVKTSSSAIQSIIGSVNNGGAEFRLNAYKVEILQDAVLSLGTSTNLVPSGAWTIIIITYTQLTGDFTCNIHGLTETISTPTGKVFTNPGNVLSFGCYQGGTGSAWQGGIAEVGRYTSVLSGADQSSLYDYLQTKYFPGTSLSQVETEYISVMATGSSSARVETQYITALALPTNPPTQIESTYTEVGVTGSASTIRMESMYLEVLTPATPIPKPPFVGWGISL